VENDVTLRGVSVAADAVPGFRSNPALTAKVAATTAATLWREGLQVLKILFFSKPFPGGELPPMEELDVSGAGPKGPSLINPQPEVKAITEILG